MIKVYVAGRHSDDNVLGVLNNIRRGIQMCKDLLLMGFAPFCPWFDHQYILAMDQFEVETVTVGTFQASSMAWLEASDCVLVIPFRAETSKGTQSEIARAHEIGKPVFFSVEGLVEWRNYRALDGAALVRHDGI